MEEASGYSLFNKKKTSMSYIKKYYTIWFCVLYKFIDSSPYRGANDFRAVTLIFILEMIFITGIFALFLQLTRRFPEISNPLFVIVPSCTISTIFKYLFFFHKDKWKEYIFVFNNIEINRRKRIAIITWGLTIIFTALSIKSIMSLNNIEWLN